MYQHSGIFWITPVQGRGEAGASGGRSHREGSSKASLCFPTKGGRLSTARIICHHCAQLIHYHQNNISGRYISSMVYALALPGDNMNYWYALSNF